jgi:hypothetical protein
VRQLLGVSPTQLHRLDGDLQPTRDLFGNRLYDPERVAEVIAARAARRRDR